VTYPDAPIELQHSDGPAPGDWQPPVGGRSKRRPSPPRSVAAAFLLPGATMLRRRPISGVLLLSAGVLAPLFMAVVLISRRADLATFVLDRTVLRVLLGVGAALILSRMIAVFIAVLDQPQRPSSGPSLFIGVLLVIGLGMPVVYGMVRLRQVDSLVGEVFAESGSAEPIVTAVEDEVGAEFHTVLLLGGDEGPGRFGLRTDTMIIVMVHRESGRSAMISIPRNLNRLQFPPGSEMADRYPNGFDDIANAVYPRVYNDKSIAVEYLRGDLEPPAVALMEGVSYSLGITIDDYALVNMQGFLDLIDAVGGVAVDIDKELPMPGNVPGAKRPLPRTLGPGVVKLDGTLALAFVRSRSADSDYQRMERQRDLLTALAAQVNPRQVLGQFGDVVNALKGTLRTSMTTEEAIDLAERLQSGDIDESIGLVPPLVEPGRPNYDAIKLAVGLLRNAIESGVPSQL
jgi:polyisoprenyl-teichoic acid--peptidoglycan teichoic acid transferase